MPAATAHGFPAVTEAGAVAPRLHAMAAGGAVLAGSRVAVRVCGRLGIPPAGETTHGETCDWVRRQLG